MIRVLAIIASFAFLIALLLTDLTNFQRWIITGLIWGTAIANWNRD